MRKINYNNNVESNQVADFDTLEQAKQYCTDECKGYEPVCDGDTEYEHRATTKHYEVFNMERQVAMLINDGFIRTYGQVIEYLRKKYTEKYLPPVLKAQRL